MVQIGTWAAVAALTTGLAWSDAALAQTAAQDRARATTQSLNTGPSDSVMRPDRVTASPPLTEAERPVRIQAPVAPAVAPSASSVTAPAVTPRPVQAARPAQAAPDDAATRLLNGAPSEGEVPGQAEAADPAAPVDFPPLQQGYYVRGEMDCDQVWPGEGDLAWLSEISFTLDFGGCTPGQIRQAGPALWHEDQRCETELGGDGGLYSIEYRQTAAGTLVRKATLSIDGTVEEDSWKACPVERVPEEARFHSPSAEPVG